MLPDSAKRRIEVAVAHYPLLYLRRSPGDAEEDADERHTVLVVMAHAVWVDPSHTEDADAA